MPSPDEGLKHLITTGFLDGEDLLEDPWGQPVQYLVPGRRSKDKFDVFSKGQNRIAGDDDDIGNWSPSSG